MSGAMRPATLLHASCVAFDGRGVLILGPSGAGKSSLALELMALGAGLVADDRTELRAEAGRLVALRPAGLPKLIEARGIGLLGAAGPDRAALVLAVDLGQLESERLPPHRQIILEGISLDLVHGPVTRHFPAAIRQYVLIGRQG